MSASATNSTYDIVATWIRQSPSADLKLARIAGKDTATLIRAIDPSAFVKQMKVSLATYVHKTPMLPSFAMPTMDSPSVCSFSARTLKLLSSKTETLFASTTPIWKEIDTTQVLGLLLFLLTLVKFAQFANAAWQTRHFARWEREHGCRPASALPKPFLSTLRHKLKLLNHQGGDLLDVVFADKYRKYGATHALHDSFGRPHVIHTIDPLNLSAVLNGSFEDWKPSKSRTNTLYPLAQEGLLTTDGQTWHHNRKMIQRHIGTKRAKDVRDSEVDIQLLFDAIGQVGKDGWTETVDLLDLFHRLALDMSTTYLLGTSANSQAKGIFTKEKDAAKLKFGLVEPKKTSKAMTYDEAYETVRNYFSWRSKLGSKYWLADGFNYRKACDTLNRFADDLIESAIQRSQQFDSDKQKTDFGLIDSLVREIGDPVHIRNLVMDLFIAGQNMTGTMAAWTFAQLEAHPDVYQAIRKEVLEKFGTEQEPRASLTWDNLRACSTMQRAITETLRMYPLLANIGRNAKRDTVLPRGGGPDGSLPIAVPAGAALTANVYLMHRRGEEWGNDAWEWDPERWSNGRKFGPDFAPFGAGPRICIGQQLTMTELSFLIARMLQRFSDMKAPEGQDNLTKGYRVVVAPKNGVKVRLQLSK